MKEKTLFKIALICSFLGLIGLYFISDRISIDRININEIGEEDLGKEVKIIGKIERVTNTDKVVFLEISEMKTESISVILFKDRDVELKEGSYVEIEGEIDEYNGEREVIASKIKLI
jgi:DNA/RNA endonuclease YhcR with UshA esterase domain